MRVTCSLISLIRALWRSRKPWAIKSISLQSISRRRQAAPKYMFFSQMLSSLIGVSQQVGNHVCGDEDHAAARDSRAAPIPSPQATSGDLRRGEPRDFVERCRCAEEGTWRTVIVAKETRMIASQTQATPSRLPSHNLHYHSKRTKMRHMLCMPRFDHSGPQEDPFCGDIVSLSHF